MSAAADNHETMEAGFAAIAGGDGRIGEVLYRVCASRPERAGAITAYGGVHAFARDIPVGSTRDQLLAIMAGHASARFSAKSGRGEGVDVNS